MKRNLLVQTMCAGAAVCLLAFATGCQTGNSGSASTSASVPAPAQPAPVATQPSVAPAAAPSAPAPQTPPPAPAPQAAPSVVRVNAGASESYTDPSGNVWQADKGFEGGGVVERPATAIGNTQVQEIYRSEHYAMETFSCDVPNGKYLAKLHFAETFEGITGPGERVFSFNVHGREFKDFDVWVKAGGPNRAYVETVPAEVTDGKFKITFTGKVENPQICGIELIPQ